MKNMLLLSAGWLMLTAFSPAMQAQTSINTAAVGITDQKSVYESETIYLNGNMTRYTKNYAEKRVGVFGRFLKKEFETCSPESREEMLRSSKNKKQGTILSTTGGVALAAAIIITGPIGLGLAGAALVPYTIGIIKLNRSQNQVQKAVWLHNRDVLAGR